MRALLLPAALVALHCVHTALGIPVEGLEQMLLAYVPHLTPRP